MQLKLVFALMICLLSTGCAHFAGGKGTADEPFKAYKRGVTLTAPPATLQIHENLDQSGNRYFLTVDGHDVPKSAMVLELEPGEHEIEAAQVITEHSATLRPFEQEKTDTVKQRFESGKHYYLIVDQKWDEDKHGSRLMSIKFSIGVWP